LDLIKTKTGDAYDFAIIFTALLRAAGIPVTNYGVTISKLKGIIDKVEL